LNSNGRLRQSALSTLKNRSGLDGMTTSPAASSRGI
jgi:hypothetical protein